MKARGVTLNHFLAEQRGAGPEGGAGFRSLMTHLGLAAKIISKELRHAGLVDVLGYTGQVNVQGEAVKKLDQFANDTFVEVIRDSGAACLLASEEMEKPVPGSHGGEDASPGEYVVLFDPLDGSSNIDVNGTLGSIFSVFSAKDPRRADPDTETLRRGREQVAAGYFIYGPGTVLVYAGGAGPCAFTLEPGCGEFLLSHPGIRIPKRGKTYSVNQGNYKDWTPEVRRYVDYLQEKDPPSGRPYGLRYVGTMVADLHRTLLDGGIFLYPAGRKNPEGKLRLLYEVSPMAFVLERAGGAALRTVEGGTEPVLEIQPAALHQRVPAIMGSPEDVQTAAGFFK